MDDSRSTSQDSTNGNTSMVDHVDGTSVPSEKQDTTLKQSKDSEDLHLLDDALDEQSLSSPDAYTPDPWEEDTLYDGEGEQWISPATMAPSFYAPESFHDPIGDAELNADGSQTDWFSDASNNVFVGYDSAVPQAWDEAMMQHYQFSNALNEAIHDDPSLFNYDVSLADHDDNFGLLTAEMSEAMRHNAFLSGNAVNNPYQEQSVDLDGNSTAVLDPYTEYLKASIENNVDYLPANGYNTAVVNHYGTNNNVAAGVNSGVNNELYYNHNDYNENNTNYEDTPAADNTANFNNNNNVEENASETVTAFLGSSGNDYFYVPGGGLTDNGAYVSAGDGDDVISTVNMDGTQSFVYIDPGKGSDTVQLSSVIAKTDYIYVDNGDLYNSTEDLNDYDTITYFKGYDNTSTGDILLLDKDITLYDNYNRISQLPGVDYNIAAINAPNGASPLPTLGDLFSYSNSQDTATDSGITVNAVNIASSNLMTVDSNTDSDTLINLGQTSTQYFIYDSFSGKLYFDIDATSNNTYGVGDTGVDLNSDLSELAHLATINLAAGSLTADNIAITDFGSNTISDPTTTVLEKGTAGADTATLSSTTYYSAGAADDSIDASGLTGASFAMVLGGNGEDTITLSNSNTATDYVLLGSFSEVYNTGNTFEKVPDLISGFSTGEDMILLDSDMQFDTYFIDQEAFGGVIVTGNIATSTLGDFLSLGSVGDMSVSSTDPSLGATPTALSSEYFKAIDSSSGLTDLDALQDSNDYFIYDSNTSTLYFDPDASGNLYGMDSLSELAELVVISQGTDISASDIGFIDVQNLS